MKTIPVAPIIFAVLTALLAVGNLGASLLQSLELSGASSVVAGQSLTISEIFLSNGTATTEIDSVVGFDPTVFSVSNFSTGSEFSSWTVSPNVLFGSGIYDYGVAGSAITPSSGSYTVFTFTLTALSNAALGNSEILIRQNNGSSYATQVLDVSTVRSLSPAPANTYNPALDSSMDLAVNVTAAGTPATPEPATFALGAFALGAVWFLKRRNVNSGN